MSGIVLVHEKQKHQPLNQPQLHRLERRGDRGPALHTGAAVGVEAVDEAGRNSGDQAVFGFVDEELDLIEAHPQPRM